MNVQQLRETLSKFEGATFAALDTVTVPVLRGGKGNPFQGKVEKHCLGHRVILFTNKNVSGYENKVKRHLAKAGLNPESFSLGPLPWGERIPDSPIIQHNGKHYLQCVFLEAGSVEYVATESIEDSDGFYWRAFESIPKQAIQGLNEKTGSEHQGLERSEQVIVRTYAIDSIVALRCMRTELR
jgi:hypothetical protein